MPASLLRLVLDNNVVLRGLLNRRSASGRILEAFDRRRLYILLSKPVLDEYRAVLTDPDIVERFPELTPKRVEVAIRRLQYFSHYLRTVRARFGFPRDPRDEMLIELAIAGKATDIVTSDKDLLSLRAGHGDAHKRLRQRLPGVRILSPAEFLDAHGPDIGD